MPKIINLAQGSDGWINWRKGRITATDAAAIMEASPYVTPYKCWQRKLGLAPEQAQTQAMLRGHHDEPIARDLFIKEYGINMTPCCIESEYLSFIGASLDGISDCGRFILEIKSQRPVDVIPDHHMMQMQHQLLSTDSTAEKCFYVSHWEGVNKTFEVLPDPKWLETYVEKARAFFKCIVLFDPPALCARDYRDMTGNFKWKIQAQEYARIDAEIKRLEQLKELHRKELITMCDEQSACGCGIKVMKKHSKGRIDYQRACEELNIRCDNLERYRKSSISTWSITVDR